MSSARSIGIDLGTTNSVAAVCEPDGTVTVIRSAEGRETTPSVVAFDDMDGIVVGDTAAESFGFGLAEGASAFKRQMGSPATVISHDGVNYSPVDLSALVLKKLMDDAESELGFRPRQAVVTVPAYFQNPEREATLDAASRAGLEVLQLINEPTAAADYYRRQGDVESGTILVYDLGGGTFDVTVLKMGDDSRVLDTRGDPFLGGVDWDQALVTLIVDQLAGHIDSDALGDPRFLRAIRREAEATKIRLTALQKVQVSISHDGIVGRAEITREVFDEASRALVERTLAMTDEAIAGAKLRPGDIDAILLVGGSTKMPMIARAIEDRFGVKPKRTLNPDLVVASGAALKAQEILAVAGGASGLALPARVGATSVTIVRPIRDVTNFALGVIAVSEDGSAYVNREMIKRGAALPSDHIQSFRHSFRKGDQPSLELFVTQGEGRDPADVGFLGHYTLNTLPGAADGAPCEIEIGYSYDSSGIGNARARLSGQTAWTQLQRSTLPLDVPGRFRKAPPKVVVRDVSILLFIDVSGSMMNQPIAEARKAAKALVANPDLRNARIGIGVVSDKSLIIESPTTDHRKVNAAIDAIEVNYKGIGGGNAAHPFDDILRTLAGAGSARYAVVLADGVWSRQDDAVRRAQACKAAGIDVIGIGFGGADQTFMKNISSSQDLAVMTTGDKLVSAFGTIAQEISERSGLKRM